MAYTFQRDFDKRLKDRDDIWLGIEFVSRPPKLKHFIPAPKYFRLGQKLAYKHFRS
jgi:hypothetical protein